jgi:hypothetical protein
MPRSDYPSDLADKTLLRFPAGMKPILMERAKANVRSLNGEIISILARALGLQGPAAAGPSPEKANPAAASDATALAGGASTHAR